MRPLFTVKMIRVLDKMLPDHIKVTDANGQIIIHTGTYITGDPDYYKRRK